jgi:hypothetical protein
MGKMKSVVYVAFVVHPDMKSQTIAGGGIFYFVCWRFDPYLTS